MELNVLRHRADILGTNSGAHISIQPRLRSPMMTCVTFNVLICRADILRGDKLRCPQVKGSQSYGTARHGAADGRQGAACTCNWPRLSLTRSSSGDQIKESMATRCGGLADATERGVGSRPDRSIAGGEGGGERREGRGMEERGWKGSGGERR